VYLHLHSYGAQDFSLGPARANSRRGAATQGLLERTRTRVEVSSNAIEMVSILYVDDQPHSQTVHLSRAKGGWLVEGDGEKVLVGSGSAGAISTSWRSPLWLIDHGEVVQLGASGMVPKILEDVAELFAPASSHAAPKIWEPAISTAQPDWRVSRMPARVTAIEPAGGGWVAGDANGNVLWMPAGASKPVVGKVPGPISALHYYPGGKNARPGICVGDEGGALHLLNEDGTVRWTFKMPWDSSPMGRLV
jgi:hypothetical protein